MKITRFAFVIILTISVLQANSQNSVTLSGFIKEAANGETMISATVYIVDLETGVVSNTYGFYSITLPRGKYTVQYRYIGFTTISRKIDLTDDQRVDIELVEETRVIEEVVVKADRIDQNVSSIEMSINRLDMKEIQRMPAFLGEVDVIKSIQLLPGVSTVGEGASGFNVRGGSVGQNLVLLDDAPVYNASHLLGFFSVFNPDAVKDIKLYKGGIPAQFGGRLSSILDIQMKEGNSKTLGVEGGIGTIFSRLLVEAPIIKDKASFIIAGRRSYADVFAKLFTDVLDDGAALNYWDLTLKANYNINPNNRLYLSGYLGKDVFKFDKNQGFTWGNRTNTLRWNHLFSDRLFFNLTSFYSDYKYNLAFGENDLDKFEWDSRIRTTALKPQFTYFIDTQNELSFGGEFLYYRFDPANAIGVSNGVVTNISLDPKHAYEIAAYVSNKQSIGNSLELEYGLRFSTFLYTGPGNVYEYEETTPGDRKMLTSIEYVSDRSVIAEYYNAAPRISLKYQLNDFSSIKASYNIMNQYIHLISNTTASNPLDVWTPSTNNLLPEQGEQYVAGYFRNFRNNDFESSVEFYYKDTKNQVEYIDGSEILINEFIEADLLSGIGRAYGMELSVKKNTGRLRGWASYTLSRSELRVIGINRGNWYPARFDQLHNFSLTGSYEFSKRISLSTNFTFISGTPTTFPTSRFELQGYVVPYNTNESRNNIRIEDYHRLDFSITINGKEYKKNGNRRKNTDYLVIGVYNVYGRKNPFSVYFSQESERPAPDQPIPTKGTKVAIIGSIIPAISYNFKF